MYLDFFFKKRKLIFIIKIKRIKDTLIPNKLKSYSKSSSSSFQLNRINKRKKCFFILNNYRILLLVKSDF